MARWPLVLLVSLLLLACRAAPAAPEPGGPAPGPPPGMGGAGGLAAPPAVAATGGASPAPAPAAGPLETVRVGTVGSAADATIIWAQERGYLREEGLELDMQVFNGAQLMGAPLGADQLDVGGGGPGPGPFTALLPGDNLRNGARRARAV